MEVVGGEGTTWAMERGEGREGVGMMIQLSK